MALGRVRWVFLALAGASALTLAQPAQAASSCQAFMDRMVKELPDLAVSFVRPVTVSRGAGPAGDVRDMVTNQKIDGQLTCNGDAFVRFEARIGVPANAALRDGFFRVQQAAAATKMRWSQGQAARVIHSMTAEAADYLRGSAERGDHVVAGKVERHEGEKGDLGLIWTASDHSFIIVEYTP